MSRTILFIVYEFPPAGGPGVQRALKFVKYLPEFGWQPVIVTTTPDTYPVLDNTLCADIPAGTPIYRVKSYDVNRLRPGFERRKLGKLHSAINAALMLPDAALFWARLARPVVKQVVEAHQPDVLYSSFSPGSAHMLGLWAHRTYQLPWVADFRDPWSENELYPYYPGYRAINRWLERRVLRKASRIVTVSPPLAQMFQRLLDGQQSKVVTIENGYDEDDVCVLPAPQTRRFSITYTGEFSRIRSPQAFLTAIDQLIASNQIPIEEIRVVFAGKNAARYVPNRPPFELLGYLNHDELNTLRKDSDLLLLILADSPTSRGVYSGKVFEYLGCNRPTLAITGPDNIAAELVMGARAGLATRHNPAEIADAVLRYYHIWRSGEFPYSPDWELIRHFTRRNLTRLLADVLNEALSTG